MYFLFSYENNDEELGGDVIYGYSMARHLKQLEYQSSIESSEIYDLKPHLDDIDMPIPQQMHFSVLNLISDNHENYIDKLTHSNSISRRIKDMNNWLKNQAGLSDPNRAGEANDVDFMVERAIECIELHGKRPTFIAVDWWEEGDVVEAVERVNLMELETD